MQVGCTGDNCPAARALGADGQGWGRSQGPFTTITTTFSTTPHNRHEGTSERSQWCPLVLNQVPCWVGTALKTSQERSGSRAQSSALPQLNSLGLCSLAGSFISPRPWLPRCLLVLTCEMRRCEGYGCAREQLAGKMDERAVGGSRSLGQEGGLQDGLPCTVCMCSCTGLWRLYIQKPHPLSCHG